MNDSQFGSNPNSINDFLDSMDGQAGANPFANAQTAPVQVMTQVTNQAPQQVTPIIQPTATWPTEPVIMPIGYILKKWTQKVE